MHARDKGVLLHPKFSKMLHGYLKMLIPTVTSLICCLTDLAKISEDIWRMAGGLLAVTRERGCFVVHVENEGLRSEFSYAESLKPVDAEKVRRTFNKVVTNALSWNGINKAFREVCDEMLKEHSAWLEALKPVEREQSQYLVSLTSTIKSILWYASHASKVMNSFLDIVAAVAKDKALQAGTFYWLDEVEKIFGEFREIHRMNANVSTQLESGWKILLQAAEVSGCLLRGTSSARMPQGAISVRHDLVDQLSTLRRGTEQFSSALALIVKWISSSSPTQKTAQSLLSSWEVLVGRLAENCLAEYDRVATGMLLLSRAVDRRLGDWDVIRNEALHVCVLVGEADGGWKRVRESLVTFFNQLDHHLFSMKTAAIEGSRWVPAGQYLPQIEDEVDRLFSSQRVTVETVQKISTYWSEFKLVSSDVSAQVKTSQRLHRYPRHFFEASEIRRVDATWNEVKSHVGQSYSSLKAQLNIVKDTADDTRRVVIDGERMSTALSESAGIPVTVKVYGRPRAVSLPSRR